MSQPSAVSSHSHKPTVIFVRPQAAGNIGALARVMANFACSDLRLVVPDLQIPELQQDSFSNIDWALAKRGQGVLSQARPFATLAEAIADFDLVVGTSGREVAQGESYTRPRVQAEEAFQWIRERSQTHAQAQWCLVLGPEDDGLSMAEMSLCHRLIYIPTDAECPSMNVAVAAACLLYHAQIYFGQPALVANTSRKQSGATNASAGEKESLVRYVADTLRLTQFFKYPDQEAVRARLRRVFQNVELPKGELLFLFEIFYQLKAWGQGHFDERNFLAGSTTESDPSTNANQ